jgi:hypothetical protein
MIRKVTLGIRARLQPGRKQAKKDLGSESARELSFVSGHSPERTTELQICPN